MRPGRDRIALALLLGVAACTGDPASLGEPDVVDPDGDPTGGPDSTVPEPDPDPDPDPEVPDDPPADLVCFARWEWVMDGTLDRAGWYGFDPVDTDLLTYFEADFDVDGVSDRVVRQTFDAAGNLVGSDWDEGGDGVIDVVTTSTYDGASNLLTYASDGNTYSGYAEVADGVVDYLWSGTYDADDHLVREETDADADGAVDSVRVFTWDGGLLQREEHGNGNGNLDAVTGYVYDDHDRRITLIGDYRPIDGSIDVIERTVYSDPTLEIGRAELDEGNDGAVEGVRDFAYDAGGRETYYAEDSYPLDGVLDLERTTTWDAANGVMLTQESTYASLPGERSRFAFEYDGSYRLIAEDYTTEDQSGAVLYDAQQTWTFGGSCP